MKCSLYKYFLGLSLISGCFTMEVVDEPLQPFRKTKSFDSLSAFVNEENESNIPDQRNENEIIKTAAQKIIGCNLSIERKALMHRRAIFYLQVIFKEYKGPDCFNVLRQGDKYTLTYMEPGPKSHFKNLLLNGFTPFDSKQELEYFLQLLRYSGVYQLNHINFINNAFASLVMLSLNKN